MKMLKQTFLKTDHDKIVQFTKIVAKFVIKKIMEKKSNKVRENCSFVHFGFR